MRRRHAWAMGAALALWGCSDAPTEASATSAPPKAGEGQKTPLKADGSPAQGARGPFTYRAAGRRDPFRSYMMDAAARRQADRGVRHAEETETFELSQYRLSGVLTGTSQPKAMVEDPTGKGHVVRIGTRLGRAGGRVTRIDAVGLVVVEESLDPQGRRLVVSTALKLPTPENDDAAPGPGAPP